MLLMLPADDGLERDHTPYAVVHAAGAIIANNRFDGWLSVSRDGTSRIEQDTDLLAGDYFFHVPGNDCPYPIVPNFRNWRFPHTQGLPTLWRQASEYDAMDGTSQAPLSGASEPCRITGRRLALESAHIVPTAEKQWFGANRMDQYGELGSRSGDSTADAPANRIRLTCDAHTLWDGGHFTLSPRIPATAAATAQATGGPAQDTVGWYTHVLNEHEELYTHWHNRPLLALQNRAPEYFFARFAWDLFPKLQGFLHTGPPRRLAVYNQDTDGYEVRMYRQAERRVFTVDQGRGRSASPTKRQRSTQDVDQMKVGGDCRGRDAEDTGSHAYSKGKGGKRRRTPSYSDSGSQDSAVAGLRSSGGEESEGIIQLHELSQWTEKHSTGTVKRHPRPSRFPDFLSPSMNDLPCATGDEERRGRKRRRS